MGGAQSVIIIGGTTAVLVFALMAFFAFNVTYVW